MTKNKKSYQKPEITIHGNLKDVTKGNIGSGFEGNSKSNKNH